MPDAGERDSSKRVDMSKGLVLINVVVLGGRQPLINTYYFLTCDSIGNIIFLRSVVRLC